MKTIQIVLSEERNVTLTMYLNLESKEFHFAKRPLMVVLPGGGYAMCSDREAEVVALQYMAAGYQAAVLRYTLKDKGGWPCPINDYDEAMELIASHADEWNIDMDHTATVGFSAGGHLAACTATVAKHRPRGAICVYPAILKDIVDACQPGMPYPHEHVDGKTSPCFLVTARDDGLVNVNNSLVFAQALEKAGVTFELHAYSYGQHGFSVGTPLITNSAITPRAANWVPDSIGWLGEIMGKFTDKGFTQPVLRPRMNGDYEEFLSVDCTLSHMLRQPEPVLQLLKPLFDAVRAIAAGGGFTFEGLCGALGGYPIKLLLETVQTPQAAIEQLDAELSKIPNQV